jgi:hypothetical protein
VAWRTGTARLSVTFDESVFARVGPSGRHREGALGSSMKHWTDPAWRHWLARGIRERASAAIARPGRDGEAETVRGLQRQRPLSWLHMRMRRHRPTGRCQSGGWPVARTRPTLVPRAGRWRAGCVAPGMTVLRERPAGRCEHHHPTRGVACAIRSTRRRVRVFLEDVNERPSVSTAPTQPSAVCWRARAWCLAMRGCDEAGGDRARSM